MATSEQENGDQPDDEQNQQPDGKGAPAVKFDIGLMGAKLQNATSAFFNWI